MAEWFVNKAAERLSRLLVNSAYRNNVVRHLFKFLLFVRENTNFNFRVL